MPNLSIEPNERINFKIRHEDDAMLIVEKQAGIVTLPGKGHDRNTLLNGLFSRYGARLQNIGRERSFGLLHRLDRETSGLLIVALSKKAYDALREAFDARTIAKYYWAVTRAAPNPAAGVIKKPILEFQGEAGWDEKTKKLARISSSGKPSITAYRTLSSSAAAALLECRAVTGRLHQVRVHLDSIGCAILGDDLYGPVEVRHAAPRLALHAHRLAFAHPVTGVPIDVRSPFPKDLRSTLDRLNLARPDAAPSEGQQAAHELPGDAVGEEEA